MTRKERNHSRTAEKYHRLAYELEADAARLRADGYERAADWAKSLASKFGDLARQMDRGEA